MQIVLSPRILIESLGKISPKANFQASLLLAQNDDDADIASPLTNCLENRGSGAPCAAWILGTRKIREAIPQLISASLSTENKTLSRYSIWALSKFLENGVDDPRVEESLTLSLKSRDPQIRETASFALGKSGKKEAIDGLIECLYNEDSDVRCDAAWILGNLGEAGITSEEATFELMKCLEDEHSAVRRLSAKALGKIGDVKAVNSLISLSDNEGDPEVAWHADKALEKISEKTQSKQ